MPIYEYACRECDTKFEKLVRSMNSDDAASCPKCGSPKTARALSLFAVGAESAKAPDNAGLCHCGKVPGSCGGMG